VDLIATRGATQLYGPAGQVAADIMTNIKTILEENTYFKNGQYYQGILTIINQVSSLLLEALPYGGTGADVLNVAGTVATAYVYGYFVGH
jgi:hypothetical protein